MTMSAATCIYRSSWLEPYLTNLHSVCWQTGTIPKLSAILEDSDDEEQPDAVVVVPHKKVKLVVGPGGEKIKHIQHKSKCRLQVEHSTESVEQLP